VFVVVRGIWTAQGPQDRRLRSVEVPRGAEQGGAQHEIRSLAEAYLRWPVFSCPL
jgi:hypothetical protein